MPKYRKISEVIRAWQNTKGAEVPDWLQGRGQGVSGEVLLFSEPYEFKLLPNEWIVQNERGTVTRMGWQSFANTYEPAGGIGDTEQIPIHGNCYADNPHHPGHITWLPDGALMPQGWEPKADAVRQRTGSFLDNLMNLINRLSMESGSDTPDFILAEFLTTTLMAFDAAMRQRDQWYGGSPRQLKAQLEAEGEHTAAANAELDRIRDLNLRQAK